MPSLEAIFSNALTDSQPRCSVKLWSNGENQGDTRVSNKKKSRFAAPEPTRLIDKLRIVAVERNATLSDLLREGAELIVEDAYASARPRTSFTISGAKDPEWVALRREFLAGRTEASNASDEVAALEHRTIQAQWLIDHVDVLEEGGAISEEKAVQIRRFRPLR